MLTVVRSIVGEVQFFFPTYQFWDFDCKSAWNVSARTGCGEVTNLIKLRSLITFSRSQRFFYFEY